MRQLLIVVFVLGCVACNKNEAPPGEAPAREPPAEQTAPENAQIGKPAPDFNLTTLDGNKVKLSDYRGKIVVLEWFNPECPFVKQSHTEGELKGMAAKFKGDVVWLAINSNGPGTQGNGADTNREGKDKFAMDYPIAFDEDGKVGKSYGAERTPHMYVIDPNGVLVYRGAIDNTKGGDAEDVPKVINYVADAIADVKAGKSVRQAETEAWGCTVKYRN
ncbi:MAG TPA: redoxin domain-containing protein [Polyangiaceae bacterium]|jgi:peroxiredoxin|nr:redoxin domain-containing protein [Polyangiaceae bacterium]